MQCARPTRLWLWPNLLSLDAPLVAVLWQVLFARCFHAPLQLVPALLLPLTVWLIYSADRALDALRGCGRSPRHQFYRAHWQAIAPIWIAVILGAGWLAICCLPTATLKRGLIVLSAVGVYLWVVHSVIPGPRPSATRRFFSKEFSVGILFALGSSLVAWGDIKTASDAATIVLFAGLCAINCAAIEIWEHPREDRAQGSTSIASAALLAGFAAAGLLFAGRPVLGGAELASATALLILDRARSRLNCNALCVLADVSLLSPVLFLPVAGWL